MEFVYNALDQEIQKYEEELEKCKHCQQIRIQIQSLKKAIEAMKSTQQPKPSEFSQLSVVDKSGEEKIPENKTIAEIIKKSTQDKKYYVIYNGPMKGVYDAWEKAAPFTHQSRIIHKGGFLTLEEAKESFREYEALHPEQTLKRADKAPIQTQRTGIIRNIPTRAEIKEKKRVCRSNLRETLNIVLNWTE